MNSDVDWAAQAKRFQQDLGTQWTKALQTIQEGAGKLPSISFSPERLQELQKAYMV